MSVRRFFRGPWLAAGIAVLTLIVGGGAYAWSRSAAPEVPFSEFLRRVDDNVVRQVVIEGDRLTFTTQTGDRRTTIAPGNYVAANAAFIASLSRQNVTVAVRSMAPSAGYGGILLALAGFGIVAVALYRVTNGNLLGLGQTVQEAGREHTTVTFEDVAGVDEAKEEVQEIVDFLRAPERFTSIGGRIPKGVLLVGPPGTGKTLLARSIAGEAGVPFLFASGSDFVEMYAGVGARRIRNLFKDACRHPACIVFIDEIDAVGRKRGGDSLSHEEREQTLNQLLVAMDGFASNQGVVVVAATNRPDILDPALLRPGRFDRQVSVGAPDVKGREQILQIHARRVTLDAEVNLMQVARGTTGFSGAELSNLVNEAALLAVRRGRHSVTTYDFDQARDKILMGAERKSLTMSEDERMTCAFHESGHAIVAALLPDADPLHKVTIIPRGRALGVTMQVPTEDRHTHSRGFLEAQLAILMGGRVAEEVFLRQQTSGARNDIERASEIARRMVCEFGMSETLGPLLYPWSGGEADASTPRVSEATAQLVDQEVRALIMNACNTARGIIDTHRRAVEALAAELLAVESLDADGIKAVIASAGVTTSIPELR